MNLSRKPILGFNRLLLDRRKNWLGIYYSDPSQIWLEKGGVETPRPKIGLNLAEEGFFDLKGGNNWNV